MSDLRKRIPAKPLRVSANGLKYFSAAILLLVNINTIILEKGILQLDVYSPAELVAAMDASAQTTTLVGAASIIRLLSGIIVPIFAFLLVEGYVHTGSYKAYLGAIAATAIVSEPVYDYAMQGTFPEFSQQNPVFAMLIGLAMLGIISTLDSKAKTEKWILRFLILLSSLFWVVLLHVEYGVETVILVAILYCFRERTAIKTILGVLVSVLDPLGPIAFCGLILYNGNRSLRIHKYCFYAFYPLHLLVLGIITRWFLL